MFEQLKKKKRHKSTYKTFEVGFHGDKYLLELVDYLVEDVSYFIETGSNVGTTFIYFAKKYYNLNCFTCEPDNEAYRILKNNINGLNNANSYHMTSQKFLTELRHRSDFKSITNSKTLFWLDAHSYGYEWPLREEITFVSENFKNAYILIDDFKNPKHDIFGYDEYDGQVCSHEYIKESFGDVSYQLIYPNYTEITSNHHPLRGWGLYIVGEKIALPENIGQITFKI